MGGLAIIGGTAVPAFDILEVKNVMALVLHFREHFSRMSGMNAVVSGRGQEENARIFLILYHFLIRRIATDIRPLFRFFRIAVFVYPTRSRQQFMKTLHVKEWHLANYSSEKVGTLGKHHTHEQPAVRATLDTKMFWRGHLASDQIFGHADEVVIRALSIFLAGRVMPIWAKLMTAANVGDNVNAAALQPSGPD